MADLTIKLNANDELVAVDDSGNEQAVPFESIKIDSGLLDVDEIQGKSLTLTNDFTGDIDSNVVIAQTLVATDLEAANSVELPEASPGDSAPSNRCIAIDPSTGSLLIAEQ